MSIVTQSSEDRVMAFIDLRNMMKACTTHTGLYGRIDYGELVKSVAGERRIAGAYIFDGLGSPDDDSKTEMLHRCLKYQGFRVRARDSYDSETRQQKEVDVDMACEMMMQAFNNSFDTAIVFSGDRDFVSALEHIQAMGKTVEVAAFSTSVNRHLIRAADRYHCIDNLPVICMEAPAEDVPEAVSVTGEIAEVAE